METYTSNGFVITKSGTRDWPWVGRKNDGVWFRADTLRGAFLQSAVLALAELPPAPTTGDDQ